MQSYTGSPFLHLYDVWYFLGFLLAASTFPVSNLVLLHLELVQDDRYSSSRWWTSSFPSTIYWRCFYFSSLSFWHLYQILNGWGYMYSCLDLRFCSVGLFLWQYHIVCITKAVSYIWNGVPSSTDLFSSVLFWLPQVFCDSIWIIRQLFLFLWRMRWWFWLGLHWIYK